MKVFVTVTGGSDHDISVEEDEGGDRVSTGMSLAAGLPGPYLQ